MTDRDEQRRAQQRAQRRAFVRAHHPDVGGDPEAFMAGLAEFDRPRPRQPVGRPSVYRSRRADRVVLRAFRTLRRRLTGAPSRNLK